jgi:hypothetical protein
VLSVTNHSRQNNIKDADFETFQAMGGIPAKSACKSILSRLFVYPTPSKTVKLTKNQIGAEFVTKIKK